MILFGNRKEAKGIDRLAYSDARSQVPGVSPSEDI